MSHQEFKTCIEACYTCAAACDHCANACLQETHAHHMANCIRADLDCADICRLAAAAMARNSAFVSDICRLCAQICEACAAECAQHSMDHCQACATACQRCADECRRMVG